MAKDYKMHLIFLFAILFFATVYLVHRAITFDHIYPNPLPTELEE